MFRRTIGAAFAAAAIIAAGAVIKILLDDTNEFEEEDDEVNFIVFSMFMKFNLRTRRKFKHGYCDLVIAAMHAILVRIQRIFSYFSPLNKLS